MSAAADQASAAAASLQLLLREDPLLVDHGMTELNPVHPDESSIPYAAALLEQQQQQQQDPTSLLSGADTTKTAQERADGALQDVERKLALVESLAVKLSRTSPEAVAGHLLRLHGYQVVVVDNNNNNNKDNHKTNHAETTLGSAKSEEGTATEESTTTTTTMTTTTTSATLSAIRERADRLERQSQVLETVAKRVEGSLQRGLDRMNVACLKLQRVLALSTTLKMILRAQFENAKLQNYDLDGDGGCDWRDLTKAAASVAILEDLLRKPELSLSSKSSSKIALVEQLRPEATRAAASVRRATQVLLEKYYQDPTAVQQLGATLQVYYSLGELPQAVWNAVDFAHGKAETACRQLWNPATLLTLAEHAASSSSDARSVAKRLVQLRLEAAEVWSQGIAEATTSVRNLQRVLRSKTDPESRQVFLDVVAQAPIPREYQPSSSTTTAAQQQLQQQQLVLSSQKQQQQQAFRDFSLFHLFWQRFCRTLAGIIKDVLHQVEKKHHHHKLERADVAALYPPVRRVAKQLVGQLQESLPLVGTSTSSSSSYYEEASGAGAAATTGILGGSRALDMAFYIQWSTTTATNNNKIATSTNGTTSSSSSSSMFGQSSSLWLENPQEAAQYSADAWTQTRDLSSSVSVIPGSRGGPGSRPGGGSGSAANAAALTSAIFQSKEWKALCSNRHDGGFGLYPLQQAFVEACTDRLCQPLQYMFPDHLAVDGDGVPIVTTGGGGLSLLPSKFDVQRFDENIRQELSLADPKEGGGEFTAVTMIAECVVDMIQQFCSRARNALSGAGDEHYLQQKNGEDPTNWTMTEALQHDRKVAAIMYTLHTYLESGPEKAFIAPYRPATSPQHEEAAALCLTALQPALNYIDDMVKSVILDPLCRASNRRLADMIAKIHLGVYMEGRSGSEGGADDEEEMYTSFVQNELAPVYEAIANQILTKFPPPYASILAANLASFSIHAFLSNAALIRPLGESARLHLTQDLADLELALEQLVLLRGGGGSGNKSTTPVHLSQIDHGRPYAELRAVRHMLFWNGFESKNKSGSELAKGLLREAWIRDLRPSTIIHYLFSYAPSLLSSPHHAKRIKAEDYVFSQLVHLDGSVDDGEEDAWFQASSCCDSYAQRASSAVQRQQQQQQQLPLDGDARVAEVLVNLGPELLRRRRH
ncbi:hypothetical protein ACA910_013407 [Epithemia clementina (nom. ined.)]